MFSRASVDSSNNNNTTMASREPAHIVSARRKQMDLYRSDVEDICEEISCDFEQKEE
jgi:hypothetical protein